MEHEFLRKILRAIEAQGEKIMSALTDLQTAVTDIQGDLATLTTEVGTVLTTLQGLQNGTVNADDPAVEAAATALGTVHTGLMAINSQLAAAVAPPAPPAPPANP
jgi:hypothetical protein